MSALGQKQTFEVRLEMSAYTPKADIATATQNVRLVPIADMAVTAQHTRTGLGRVDQLFWQGCLAQADPFWSPSDKE